MIATFRRSSTRGTSLLTVGLMLAVGSVARAEHGDINLSVSQSGKQVEAHADTEPPQGGLNETPVFKMKAGEPASLQFIFVNVYPHREVPGVTVRYYVTPIHEPGQKETPSPDDGHAVMRGQMTMPFKPQCRAGARLQFTLPAPGCYRVRIDTRNTQSDHEHFSAIDLVSE
jgi:hypothetical protein